jgi:NAD-dependent deacetylase
VLRHHTATQEVAIKQTKRIRKAAELLRGKRDILVYSGAGLDAGSGIPTFDIRESDAIVDWGIKKWREYSEWREQVWDMYPQLLQAKPNPGHVAILQLVDSGLADHVTSNVTGLSVGALELCGNAKRVTTDLSTGLNRPDVVFMGETFPEDVMREYWSIADRADALVIVGASPLIGLWETAVVTALTNDIPIIVINRNPEPDWQAFADVIIKAPAEQALPKLVAQLDLPVQATGGE